jgi:hypothetical protein
LTMSLPLPVLTVSKCEFLVLRQSLELARL